MKKNVHVTWHKKKKQWAIKTTGSTRAAKNFRLQVRAIRAGRRLAKKRKCELLIHRKDGKIRYRDSYGHDPFPPRG